MAEVDNNIAVVLYHYLRVLSVKVSRSTVHRLLDTPLGGSIRGISDVVLLIIYFLRPFPALVQPASCKE